MGLCASYLALARFMSGQDLYIAPRNKSELSNTLRSYSYDALHNLISQSRRELPPGGYSLVSRHAFESSPLLIGGIIGLRSGRQLYPIYARHRRKHLLPSLSSPPDSELS